MHGTVWPAYLGDLMAASPPIACDAALQFSCICLVSSKNPNTARAYVLRVATLKLLLYLLLSCSVLAKRMKQPYIPFSLGVYRRSFFCVCVERERERERERAL